MKKYFMFAVVAAMFAACSNSDEELMSLPTQDPVVSGQTPVAFDVYTSRALKRAGAVGVMDLDKLKEGFGVFAYYTDANEYDPQAVPNFMYNQKVTWETDHFEYSPVKYWPNEYGNAAMSDEQDKISFFAYSPYVDVVPSSGKLEDASDGKDKWGITGMSRNAASGDPLVKYIASFDAAKSVDLCWGVVGDGETAWSTMDGGQTMTAGLPWLNVERAANAVDQKLKFTFKHALAQFKVNIDAFVDGIGASNALGSGTKIWVRSVSFTGMATKGSLNLNNTQSNVPVWLDYNGTADLESGEVVTIYDGRKDGKEGAAGATAANEKTLGLNPVVISDDGNSKAGVTNTTVSLFASNNAFYVIPTNDAIEVEIVYDVETADPNLATYLSDGARTGSSIENKIKKTITWASSGESKFENGKSYVLNLHLGMNSVKFDADVVDWAEDDASSADLPANMPVYTAGATGAGTEITLPAAATSYEFAVNGLVASEALTWTYTTAVEVASDATANAFGYGKTKGTVAANATTSIVDAGSIKVAGAEKEYTLTIKKAAAALDFSAISYDSGTHEATCTIGNADVTALNAGGITVSMQKDGAAFTDFTLAATKVITLTSYATGTYSVTITANDAAPVTKTFTIE